MSNLNLYQNGILRVYSPRKGRDWQKVKEFFFIADFFLGMAIGITFIILWASDKL